MTATRPPSRLTRTRRLLGRAKLALVVSTIVGFGGVLALVRATNAGSTTQAQTTAQQSDATVSSNATASSSDFFSGSGTIQSSSSTVLPNVATH